MFVPLYRQWFDAFRAGTKTEEWRLLGSRWNANSCWIGRPVTLSLGYTMTRLHGTITSFRVETATGGAIELYGKNAKCAVFGIKLDTQKPVKR